MRVDEVFTFDQSEEEAKHLQESMAIAKIRKEARERSKSGKRPTIVVMQSPDDKGHYSIFVAEDGKSYSTQMIGGKFKNTRKISVRGMSKMVVELELKGWRKVDSRGWAEKYKMVIMFGLVGFGTAIGLGSAGFVPITAVLMPIVTTFFGLFSNLFIEHINNPIKSALAGLN